MTHEKKPHAANMARTHSVFPGSLTVVVGYAAIGRESDEDTGALHMLQTDIYIFDSQGKASLHDLQGNAYRLGVID